MIQSGLASITFRDLSVKQIITLVCRAGLDGIEWGGEVHVPHGDLDTARIVGELTRKAGLVVTSYGSYYRAWESEHAGLSFESVLETALALQTRTIRVWAGAKGTADSDAQYRANVVADLQRIARLAEAQEIHIALEHHKNTLTDETLTAMQLIEEADVGNLRLYWQPPLGADAEQCEESLGTFLPYLANLHVFHWALEDGERIRLPLAKGIAPWRRYVNIVNATGRDHFALIEFVRGDTPEQFLSDAETLKAILE